MRRLRGFPAGAALVLAGLLAGASLAHAAATILINNLDGPGEGFNDGTPVSPVGGNTGTTIGQQRLIVFQTAASIWGANLNSTVFIIVNAQFNPLSCTATAGVLGSAGPTEIYRDFPGAVFPGTWYHVALANKRWGADLNPAAVDINATFNSSLGGATCLPVGWYYGLDGNEGGQIELLPVVLHEMGHGLGFSTTTSGTTGAQLGGFPHVWDHFLFDDSNGQHWNEENDAQRAASAISCSALAWDGPAVRARAPAVLGTKSLLRVTAPSFAEYSIGAAAFGPALGPVGVSGPVVLVNDGVANPTNGCEPIVNSLAGKIAFIDRGTCSFTVKVKNAQVAGAIGAIIADTLAGCPPAGMGGADATITIPSVRVTQADGNTLRALLAGGVTATLIADPARHAGTDVGGRVLMYAPNPFEAGSSVSHWDTSAEPSLLMEPAITTGLSSNVDLTRQLFGDIGWEPGLAGVGPLAEVTSLEPCAPNPVRSSGVIAYSLAQASSADVRVYDIVGREVGTLASGAQSPGRHAVVWRGLDAAGRRLPPGIYRVRLRTPGFSQTRSVVLTR